jgi:hypothetical protein
MFTEHPINKHNNFIMGWYADDFSFIDEFMDIYNDDSIKTPGYYGSSEQVNKDIKDSIDCGFYAKSLEWLKYGKVLEKCVSLYTEKYPNSLCAGHSVQEGFAVQHYPPNGGYKVWHSERESADMMNVTRHLVFMTYLNDVTDEGGTEFLYQGVKIRADKGLTLIWPADWTFTHRGVVSPTQHKYIVTGWINLLKETK